MNEAEKVRVGKRLQKTQAQLAKHKPGSPKHEQETRVAERMAARLAELRVAGLVEVKS